MKKMRVGIVLAGLLSSLLLLGACSDEEKGAGSKDGKIGIVTTIAQIADPISIIGGDHVAVESLMGPGVDPHLIQSDTRGYKEIGGQ